MKWLNSSHWLTRVFFRSLLVGNFFIVAPAIAAEVVSLDELLRKASEQSESFQALERSIRALEADIRSRDLELSTQFTSELAQVRDHRQTTSTTPRLTDSTFLDLGLSKPFATGTSLSLTTGHTLGDVDFNSQAQNTAEWEVRLSQSLWRNSFGEAIGFRRQSDRAELKARKYEIEFQKQNLLVDLENLYWDLSLALKQEEIRLANIKRSESLETWIRDRVRRSAAETSELLQVQALSSNRQLDLISTRNQIAQLRNQLQQVLPGRNFQTVVPDLKILEVDRPIQSMIRSGATGATPVRLDALANGYNLEKAEFDAKRVDDSLDPLFDAYVSYGQNGIENQFQESWKTATNESYYYSQVGVIFSMALDRNLKNDRRLASKLQVESQNLQLKALQRSSTLEWSDLQRNIESLKAQATESQKLSEFQRRKSLAEHQRYRLGKTTVFQAVTFEVEAAAAELQFYSILATLRKTEARARVYTAAQAGDL